MFIRHCFMFWITLLIMISFVLPSFAQDQSSSTGIVAPPLVTRVSGCTDTGDITINCPRGASFQITVCGTNFLNLPKNSYFLELEQGNEIHDQVVSTSSSNDTCLVFQFRGVRNGHFMNTDLLNVTIEVGDEPISPPFAGLSFEAPVPLVFTRITSCSTVSEDGLTASGCDLLIPITIFGSGFHMLVVDRLQIKISSLAFDVIRVVNDSMIVIDLGAYMWIPAETFLNAVDLRIIYSNSAEILALSLTFTCIPSTEATGVTATYSNDDTGCINEGGNGIFRLTGCFSGRSVITISGRFIWPGTQIWLGPWSIYIDSSTQRRSDLITFTLPIIDTESGVYYDIKIVNAATSLVLKNVVNIVSTPEISGMTACVTKFNSYDVTWRAYCLEGEIFSFTAVNLNGKTTPQVWFGPYECPDVRVINNRIVQCTVPRDPDGVASIQQNLFLSWPDYNSTGVAFELWDWPLAPRVLSITSSQCYQSSNLDKPLECLFDPVYGTNVTVHTSRLAPNQIWKYWLRVGDTGTYRSENVILDESKGTLTCWIPSQIATRYYTTIINMAILVRDGADANGASNIKPMIFVKEITYDPVSVGSSDSKVVIITLCVILPLIFALVVVSYLYWRRQSVKSKGNLSGDMISDETKHIELA